jgi:hypothetical protein
VHTNYDNDTTGNNGNYYSDSDGDSATSSDSNKGGGRQPGSYDPLSPITVGRYGLCINWQNIGCSGTWETNSAATFLNAGWWNKVSTTSQDLAFSVSATGGILEIVGAATGPQDYAVAEGFYMEVLNPFESMLSWGSTATEFMSDTLSGNTKIAIQNNSVNISLGDSTVTSATMTMIGNFVPIGIADAAIDGYASGYAHGTFPGIAPGTINLGFGSVSWK